jgi:NADH-quinone oxidoreductase subunit M
LNGFVGEFLILVGSYRTLGWPVVVATFGVVLAAVYLLKMVGETVWGPVRNEANRTVPDLSAREIAALVPLAILMLWIGVAPRPFLEPSRPALEETLGRYQARIEAPAPEVATVRPPTAGVGAELASARVEEKAPRLGTTPALPGRRQAPPLQVVSGRRTSPRCL